MKLSDIRLEEAKKQLSGSTKLGIIKAWGTSAGKTCPGAVCPTTKEVKPACKGCYAKKGQFRMNVNVKNKKLDNQNAWRDKNWVDDMVEELDNHRYFRWFDSGDLYHPEQAKKIFEIMKKTTWVKHWLPTQSYDIPKLSVWLDKMNKLKNVKVTNSSPSDTGEFELKKHQTTIVDKPTAEKWHQGEGKPAGIEMCPAGAKGSKVTCDTCKKCWDKKNKKVIAFTKH